MLPSMGFGSTNGGVVVAFGFGEGAPAPPAVAAQRGILAVADRAVGALAVSDRSAGGLEVVDR